MFERTKTNYNNNNQKHKNKPRLSSWLAKWRAEPRKCVVQAPQLRLSLAVVRCYRAARKHCGCASWQTRSRRAVWWVLFKSKQAVLVSASSSCVADASNLPEECRRRLDAQARCREPCRRSSCAARSTRRMWDWCFSTISKGVRRNLTASRRCSRTRHRRMARLSVRDLKLHRDRLGSPFRAPATRSWLDSQSDRVCVIVSVRFVLLSTIFICF